MSASAVAIFSVMTSTTVDAHTDRLPAYLNDFGIDAVLTAVAAAAIVAFLIKSLLSMA